MKPLEENIAIITASVFGTVGEINKFVPDAGGFVATLALCVEAARYLTDAETPDCYDKWDWFSLADGIAAYLMQDRMTAEEAVKQAILDEDEK